MTLSHCEDTYACLKNDAIKLAKHTAILVDDHSKPSNKRIRCVAIFYAKVPVVLGHIFGRLVNYASSRFLT